MQITDPPIRCLYFFENNDPEDSRHFETEFKESISNRALETAEFLLKKQYEREEEDQILGYFKKLEEFKDLSQDFSDHVFLRIKKKFGSATATKIQALMRGCLQRFKEREAEEPKKFGSGSEQDSSRAVGKGLEWGPLARITSSPALSYRSVTPAGSQLQSVDPSICSEAESMSPSPQSPSDLK